MNGTPSSAKVFAVIGDPVAHSASPAIHNAGFAALGIDATYCALRVPSALLGEGVRGVKALGISGFNVTAPHKEAIMPLLDGVDEVADTAGAVNTVVNGEEGLRGLNTDVAGCKMALRNLMGKKELRGLNVAVLGAGGVARAAVLAVGDGNGITIVARDARKARNLIKVVGIPHAKPVGWLNEGMANALNGADLLINATPIGLEEGENPLGAMQIPSGIAVLDMVYRRGETGLVRNARARGCAAIDGKEMLLGQAFESFRHFTGRNAPEGEMRSAFEEWSRGRERNVRAGGAD